MNHLIALFQFNRASIGGTVTTLTTLHIGPTTISRLRDDEINVFFIFIYFNFKLETKLGCIWYRLSLVFLFLFYKLEIISF